MGVVYAANAKLVAPSQYAGLSVLDLAVYDGRLFAIKTDGLAEFTSSAADDEGTNIDAYIKTGKMDFGNGNLKRFYRFYYGGSASKGLDVTVTTEESGTATDREYRVGPYAGTLREKRVKLARGAKSRHVQVKIANKNGGTMAVDRADLLVQGLPRRV